MGIFTPDREIGALVAFAQIADTHLGPATFSLNRGFASMTHVEASGVYDLVLDAGMTGENQTVEELVVQAVAGNTEFQGFVTRQWLDAKTLRINVWDANGVLDDADFDVKVYRATNHV